MKLLIAKIGTLKVTKSIPHPLASDLCEIVHYIVAMNQFGLKWSLIEVVNVDK